MEKMKLIIKLGTNVIFDSEKKKIRVNIINQLVKDVQKIRKDNHEIIIVTSGAVGCGKNILGGNGEIATRQAQAAIGQPILMETYRKEFSKYKLNTAQFLLISEDFSNIKRLNNLKQTYSHLSKIAIPIVNENDTTAIDELSFGDNDELSLQLLLHFNFDTLINYTERGALIKDNKKIKLTNQFDSQFYDCLKKSGTGFGGLDSKLKAAKKATEAGKKYIIAKAGDSITEILSDKVHATRFYL